MTTPQPPESKSAAPRLIGLYRFSAVEFLIALVLSFIGIAFVEQLDKGINGSVKTPFKVFNFGNLLVLSGSLRGGKHTMTGLMLPTDLILKCFGWL
jgi:hypothetical protein